MSRDVYFTHCILRARAIWHLGIAMGRTFLLEFQVCLDKPKGNRRNTVAGSLIFTPSLYTPEHSTLPCRAIHPTLNHVTISGDLFCPPTTAQNHLRANSNPLSVPDQFNYAVGAWFFNSGEDYSILYPLSFRESCALYPQPW